MTRKNIITLFVAFVFGTLLPPLIGLITSCSTPQARSVVDQILTYEQIACVLATTITDDATLAQVCQVADGARPLVRDLVGKRASINQKAKSAWTQDAGPEAGR